MKNAAEARQDVIAFRLMSDLHSDGFLSFRPMWHSQCRNRYLLKKSYELVAQKRLTSFSATSAESDPGPSKITRSCIDPFQKKTMCVICEKVYGHVGKKPTSKVVTHDRARSLMEKAKELNDNGLLLRICHGDSPVDMVAEDICYHRECMNKYMATRCADNIPLPDIYDVAFQRLCNEIDIPLLCSGSGYLLSTLCMTYRNMLELHTSNDDMSYKSMYLRKRLQAHYGSNIVFFPHTSGTDFIYSASLSVGDVLAKAEDI